MLRGAGPSTAAAHSRCPGPPSPPGRATGCAGQREDNQDRHPHGQAALLLLGAKALSTFSALVTSGEASSEGSAAADPRRSCSPKRMHSPLPLPWPWPASTHVRASPWRPSSSAGLRRQPPASWWAGRAWLRSGALALVDPEPESDWLVAFFVGAFVAVLVGCGFGVGAGLLCTGAAPGQSRPPAVLPGEREEAAIRHAGPADPRRRVGPLAGLAVGPEETPVGIGRRGVPARVALSARSSRGRRTLVPAARRSSAEACRGKDLVARPARTTRVAALLDAAAEAVEVDHHVDARPRAQCRSCRARRRARPARPPRRVPRRPDRPDVTRTEVIARP